MKVRERIPKIAAARIERPGHIHVQWVGGAADTLDLAKLCGPMRAKRLLASKRIAAVEVENWGSSLLFGDGFEASALAVWLEALRARGQDDVREFIEWRLRANLSLEKAADLLGLSRRTIANYCDGRHAVPKTVTLAIRYLASRAAAVSPNARKAPQKAA
jgi:DNA-binding XRE family transcriptional regulator